ncbi:MAG: DUF2169 domain-containing protein [Steroidobacteraceae bacterium]
MWLVRNTTPYSAERTWVQDKSANKLWLVVVKATFDVLDDGTCSLAAQQVPVFRLGQPWGSFGSSSLKYEADLCGVKPCSDILVQGSAWVPEGRPASAVDVEMRVGTLVKRLHVFGDRVWERGIGGSLGMSYPIPFVSMPITYERAFGGWDRTSEDPSDHRMEDRNPIGQGFATQAANCIGKPLPNIEDPDRLIRDWDDRPAPAGMNAIDCAWSPRRELSGTYDEDWRRSRFPLWAEDFDDHYNNCAPPGQQASGFLAGGERVELTNLSPRGRLAFNLPRIHPVFRTRFGSERIDHEAQLCTVILEPAEPRVIMAWQTVLVCNQRMDDLDETVVAEESYLAKAQ